VPLKNYFPIFHWLPQYKKSDLRGDLFAGITVGILLIPQSMAYALLAGLPPIYGLYAAFLPQVIYGFFGTSRQLSVAPVAMISLLIAAGIIPFVAQGTPEYIGTAIFLAMLVGVLQLMFGIFRLGFLVNFLSQPVIKGYTYAAVIIISFSQLKHLLGISMSSSNLLHEVIVSLVNNISFTHLLTMIIGVLSIVFIVLARKINKSLPGPLILVALGILIAYITGLDLLGVKVLGKIPSGVPGISIPAFNPTLARDLLPLALLISMVGFMESVAIAKAIQSKQRNHKVLPNKELIGLGLANISGSLFGSFPVSGGFSRTALNYQAGAKTNISSWISAALIGLALLFFTPLFYYLPQAILAAIIIVAVSGLFDLETPEFLYKTNKKDFSLLVVSFVLTLTFGALTGIIIGVALSLGLVIHRSVYPHLAELGKLPDTNYYRNLSRFAEAIDRADALVFRFDSELYFANIEYFRERLDEMIERKKSTIRVIVLNAQSIYSIDSTAAKGLQEIVIDLKSRGIDFYLSEVIGPVRDTLSNTGLLHNIGANHIVMRVQDALDHFDSVEKPDQTYPFQTNIISRKSI
jgi:SulP family sulfate permease